jgi:hypothetical protein
MRNRRGQRGEGQLGCLVGIIFLIIAGLIAYKMVPVKVKSAELRDIVKEEARAAGLKTDKMIAGAILAEAQRLELPVGEEDLEVVRSGGNIRVDVEYTVPVKFPGYTYNWKFHHKAENPIF